jgi:hypothetical protein
MKFGTGFWTFAAVALLTLMQPAAAQGPAGHGGVATVPASSVRGGEDGRPVTQLGLIGILANPPPPGPYPSGSSQTMAPRGAVQGPPK